MKYYKLYINECKGHVKLILLGICMLTVEGILAIKLPFVMQSLMKNLFNLSSSNYSQFFRVFLLFFSLSIIQLTNTYMSMKLFKSIGIKITSSIVHGLLKKVYYSKMKQPPQFKTGDALQTINSDAFQLGEKGIKVCYRIIQTIVNIFGVFYFMWITSPFLAILLTLNFICIMLVQKKINMKIEKYVNETRQAGGDYSYTSNMFINNFNSYRKIKSKNYFFKVINRKIDAILKSLYDLDKISYINALISSGSTVLNNILILGIGSYFIINGKIDISTLITFNMYSNTFGGFIQNIPSLLKELKDFSVSCKRVDKLYNIECFDKVEKNIYSIDRITLQNISFGYISDKEILNQFSLDLCKGNIYCIVGQNGSGKSTLINIISGEYPIISGISKINNMNYNIHKNAMTISNFISYFTPNIILFNDTIKNNIVFDIVYEDSRLPNILCLLNINDDPEMALDKIIDEMHQNISDGQKQKIALARCLYDNKEVMIFDEIEKHLDTKTKVSIMNYLNLIKLNKIIIIVSHDEFIQSQCDEIISI